MLWKRQPKPGSGTATSSSPAKRKFPRKSCAGTCDAWSKTFNSGPLISKYGHVLRAADWPYSSIHRYIAARALTRDWGAGEVEEGGTGSVDGVVCWGSLRSPPTYVGQFAGGRKLPGSAGSSISMTSPPVAAGALPTSCGKASTSATITI